MSPFQNKNGDDDCFTESFFEAMLFGEALLISSDDPDVIDPNYKHGPVVLVKPSLELTFNPEIDEEIAIEAETYACLAHALNRTDLGYCSPHSYNDVRGLENPSSEQAHILLVQSFINANFLRIKQHELDPTKKHIVALFGENAGSSEMLGQFDVWRLNNNGWSGKPGNHYPRQKDLSGTEIQDIETADLGFYSVFLGYYALSDEGVLIDVNSLAPK